MRPFEGWRSTGIAIVVVVGADLQVRPDPNLSEAAAGTETNPATAIVFSVRAHDEEGHLPADILSELYDACGARLYRYAVMILADPGEAEDVVQDVFHRLAMVGRRQPDLATSGYASRMVRNACFDRLRARRRRRAHADALLLEPCAPDAREEERLMIDEALRTLPPEQREVVYLKVYEGLTFQEIADRCEMSINTAASHWPPERPSTPRRRRAPSRNWRAASGSCSSCPRRGRCHSGERQPCGRA